MKRATFSMWALPIVISLSGCFHNDGRDNGNIESVEVIHAPTAFPEIQRGQRCQTSVFETSDKFTELYVVNGTEGKPGTAIKDQFYKLEIRVEVKNEPDDDDYSYTFEYSTALQESLDIVVDNRTLIVKGYPDKKGIYELYVKAYSDDLEMELAGGDVDHCQYHIDVEKFLVEVIEL